MAWTIPERLPLANLPTPIEPLKRWSADLGGPEIWVKRDDLSGMDLSGNKIRKLEYVTRAALTEKADVLITCGAIICSFLDRRSQECIPLAAIPVVVALEMVIISVGILPL